MEKEKELPPCLKILEEHDPKYGELFSQLFELTFSPGALDAKTKMLIAMAVNANTGVGYGCSEIAKILKGMEVKKRRDIRSSTSGSYSRSHTRSSNRRRSIQTIKRKTPNYSI